MQGKPRKKAHGEHRKQPFSRVLRVALFRGCQENKLVLCAPALAGTIEKVQTHTSIQLRNPG